MSNPKLAIVTPTFNQANYIEQAIDSVLSAKARVPIEYAIIDGGSTDGTVEIIRRYQKHLAFWVSEPDSGQSNAINKGLRSIGGEYWAYLNSDDYYADGALEEVSDTFAEKGSTWITGIGRYFKDESEETRDMVPSLDWSLEDVLLGLSGRPVIMASQVSNFMSRQVLERYGYFDETFHYVMDVEFGLRLLLDGIMPTVLPRVLGMARLHDNSKTVSQGATAFPRELEVLLRGLDLKENRTLERARNTSLVRLSKRNALNQFNSGRFGGGGAGRKALLNHLIRHPNAILDREVLGALRRAIARNA